MIFELRKKLILGKTIHHIYQGGVTSYLVNDYDNVNGDKPQGVTLMPLREVIRLSNP